MADLDTTAAKLQDAAIELAQKATEAKSSPQALQYAYAAAALANGARGVAAGSGYSTG